jgi:chromosome segregation ATPase
MSQHPDHPSVEPDALDDSLELIALDLPVRGLRDTGNPTPSGEDPGADPLHFGEIDDELELVAEGETGILDGPRASGPVPELDALRKELEESRAELIRLKTGGSDGRIDVPGWLGLGLLAGNPSRRLQGTEAALFEKSRELKDLKRQIAEARTSIRELEAAAAEVERLTESRDHLQTQIDELQDFERSFADRAKRLERAREEESKLRDSIDRLQDWLLHLQKDRDSYEAILPVEREKLAQCREELGIASVEVDSAKDILQSLRSEISALQTQKDALTADHDRANTELEELTTLCRAEREHSTMLAHDVAGLESRLAEVQIEISSAEVSRDTLRAQGDRLCVALQEIEAQQSKERAKLEELTTQAFVQEKELTDAKSLAADANLRLEALVQKETEQLALLTELEAQTAGERVTLGYVQEATDRAKSERDMAREETARLRSQLEELAEMRDLGTKELESLDESLTSRRQDLGTLESEIEAAEVSRTERLAEAEAAREELAQVESTLQVRRDDLNRCVTELDARTLDHEQLCTDIAEASADKARLTKQCAARDEELAAKHETLEVVMANLVRLQGLVDAREAELTGLEARIKALHVEQDNTVRLHREELETVLNKVDQGHAALEALSERAAVQEAEVARLDSSAADLREQITSRINERDSLEAGITQKREFLGSLEQRFSELETSFQLRMEELQATRNRTEDDLAAKIASLDAAAGRLSELDSAKRDLAEVSADYDRILTLRDRAEERLRRNEERERELHERITALDQRAAELRRTATA